MSLDFLVDKIDPNFTFSEFKRVMSFLGCSVNKQEKDNKCHIEICGFSRYALYTSKVSEDSEELAMKKGIFKAIEILKKIEREKIYEFQELFESS